jgi:hypothetical protein
VSPSVAPRHECFAAGGHLYIVLLDDKSLKGRARIARAGLINEILVRVADEPENSSDQAPTREPWSATGLRHLSGGHRTPTFPGCPRCPAPVDERCTILRQRRIRRESDVRKSFAHRLPGEWNKETSPPVDPARKHSWGSSQDFHDARHKARPTGLPTTAGKRPNRAGKAGFRPLPGRCSPLPPRLFTSSLFAMTE